MDNDSVPTPAALRLCEFCSLELPAPNRKERSDQKRRFCKAKCRAAWHEREKQRKLTRARELSQQLFEQLSELLPSSL
jgi:hypothetical protein